MPILVAIAEGTDAGDVVSFVHDLATTYEESLVALHVVPEADFEAHRDAIESAAGFVDLSFEQEEDSAARYARRAVELALGEFEGIVETRNSSATPMIRLNGSSPVVTVIAD